MKRKRTAVQASNFRRDEAAAQRDGARPVSSSTSEGRRGADETGP